MADTTDTGSLASLLSGLITGGTGIAQLASGGNLTTAANTANPFGAQYGQYGAQVQGSINAIGGQQSGTNGNLTNIMNLLENNAGNGSGQLQSIIGSLAGLGGMTQQNLLPNTSVGNTTAAEQSSGSNLQTQLANLSSNYMSNPAIQSELQTGMQTVNRGLAAQGLQGSGAQQAELQQYGENFAATQYNTQYNDLIAGSNAVQGQNLATTQEQAALSQANFTNTSNADSLLTQQFGDLGSLAGTEQSNTTSALTAAGNVGGTNSNLLLNSSQGLLNSLEALSGATTGSPSTAGIIESGQFGQTQQSIANLGSGANGILSGLSSLLGGSSGSSITGGLSSLLSGLGSAATGTELSGILDQFSGGGAVSNLFGNSTTDLTDLVGDTAGGTGVLGDVGTLLGGLF